MGSAPSVLKYDTGLAKTRLTGIAKFALTKQSH